jgi:hypothetical protein
MDIFHMADIIPLLPLPYPPQGRSSYYVPCPQCDRGAGRKDKHLNINLAKDVFRCPKCGWNGGVFDLYAFYSGVPRADVREDLKRVLKENTSVKRPASKPAISVPPETVESPVADINIRHTAYSALLSMLSLAPDHMRNLLNRGLTERAVCENEYRTTPMIGEKILAKQIRNAGNSLVGVPGFYTDKSGQWTFVSVQRGILIPVRDSRGRIQGLQIRRDDAKKRKYRWISGANIEGSENGCKAEGWTHLAGPVKERILLIEGPLKADIVHHLTGHTVLAVPGVNALKHLEATLVGLTELGVKQAMTAFDMDFLKNPHVRNGYVELTGLLGRMNLRFGTYLWRPDCNGLDDYLRECCLTGERAL